MATLIGRVGMVTKGVWNSTSTYEVMDVVSYNSATYIAKQNVPANTLPTNTTYWQPALVSDIIGNTPLPIPSSSITTITQVLSMMPAYIYSVKNGIGAGICGSEGFYIILARHNTDTSAYFIGIVYKANSVSPVVTVLANNKLTVNATNTSGTVAFNYNDESLGDNGVTMSCRFMGGILRT